MSNNSREVVHLAKELKLLERIKLKLQGHIYLYEEKKDGWKQPMPIYLIECPIHGLVESHPQGFDNHLTCPLCIKEGIPEITVNNT